PPISGGRCARLLRTAARLIPSLWCGGAGGAGAGGRGGGGARAGARLRLEVQRGGVDAVPLPARAGAVVEDMSQVPAAISADDLGATHEQAVVRTQLHGLRHCGLGEAGPAGAGVELRLGAEQLRPAGGAAILPRLLVVGVRTGERRLGTRLSQHLILRRRQLLAPLELGLFDVARAHAMVLAPGCGRSSAHASSCYCDPYVHVRFWWRETAKGEPNRVAARIAQ